MNPQHSAALRGLIKKWSKPAANINHTARESCAEELNALLTQMCAEDAPKAEDAETFAYILARARVMKKALQSLMGGYGSSYVHEGVQMIPVNYDAFMECAAAWDGMKEKGDFLIALAGREKAGG